MAKLEIKHLKIKAGTAYPILSAESSYSCLKGSIFFSDLSATDVILDPDTLNRYFRLEPFTVNDLAVFSVGKVLDDSFSTIDNHATLFGKVNSDAIGFTDDALIVLLIRRFFDDIASTTDNAVLHPSIGKSSDFAMSEDSLFDTVKSLSDAPVLTESKAYDLSASKEDIGTVTDLFSKSVSFIRGFDNDTFVSDAFDRIVAYSRSISDSTSLSENYIGLFGKSLSDTPILSETLARTVIYERQFSDFFTLDDITDVSAKVKDFEANKTNVIGFSDIHSFGTSKLLTDSATVSEDYISLLAKPFTESVSATDSDAKLLSKLHSDDFGIQLSEDFSRSVDFTRDREESISIADLDQKSLSRPLSDSASVSDQFDRLVDFKITETEAISLSSNAIYNLQKSITESVAFTESIDVQLLSLASSVLNAGALNTSPLNN